MTPQQRIEFFACLALKHTPGLGLRGSNRLLNAHPSAKEALDAARNHRAQGLISDACCRSAAEEAWREKAETEYRAALKSNMNILLRSDPEYPDRLQNIPAPPLFLYYIGDITLLNNPAITVVGSRTGSPESRQDTLDMCARLSGCGITIVSGMALGIDRQAHLGGLTGIGSSIGVAAAGLDVDYPSRNRDLRDSMEHRGLLLSEFAPGEPARGEHFPQRNRIMSGLSLAVAVMEAGTKSGSLITAREALEQGRDVFARPGLPHDPDNAGGDALLNDGAHPLRSAEDLLLVMGETLRRELPVEFSDSIRPRIQPNTKKKHPTKSRQQKNLEPADRNNPSEKSSAPKSPPRALPELSETEAALLEALPESGGLHPDEAARAAGVSASEANAALVMMEIKGVVRMLPGMRYVQR